MARLPIGLQMYTLRDESAKDYVGTVTAVAEMGYEGIEDSAPPGMNAGDFRRLLDGLGIVAAGTHTSLDALESDLDRVAEFWLEVGAKYITVSSLPESRRADGDGWRTAAAAMSEVGGQLAERGLVLCYHNHSFEFQTFDGEYGLDIFYGAAHPTHVQGEIDTYWVQHGGEDPAEYIRKMPGRTPLIHIKDMAEDGAFAEVGEGVLDWEAIFEASEAGGAAWYIVEQDVCQRPPLESVRLTLDNLRKMGKLG